MLKGYCMRLSEKGREMEFERDKNVTLTIVIAGGKHSFICRTGCNVPYLPRLVQKDILIYDVILVIKVNDVNLKKSRDRESYKKVKLSLKQLYTYMYIISIQVRLYKLCESIIKQEQTTAAVSKFLRLLH